MGNVQVRLSGTNLVRAADHNQRITLQAIRVHGSLTRVALARITGLTAAAVANIIKRLTEDDLIKETGRLHQGRGQPGKLLQINPDARVAFGVNIDRDHVSLVLINFVGKVVAERHHELAFALPAQVRALWLAHAQDMLAEAGASLERLVGIGVAMPDDLGAIRIPGTPDGYRDWTDADCAAMFATPFDVPVFVENDASAAALGEQQFGCGHEYSSALYVLISSGLGGGILIDGHYVRGATGRSGEIGLIPTGRGDELVQDHVSSTGLAAVLGRAGLGIADLARIDSDGLVRGFFDLWLDGAVERLVPPLVAANCLLNPAGVLIGARMPPQCTDMLAARLEAALRDHRPALPSCAAVRRARLSTNAPAIGAAILPFSHLLLPRADALWKDED